MKVSKQNIMNLLSSVSSDGRGAFERFYNLYYDQVFRFAYYCLGEKEACKEVVSDVFFSIWKSKALTMPKFTSQILLLFSKVLHILENLLLKNFTGLKVVS